MAASEFARLTRGTLHIVNSYSAYQGPNRSATGGYVDNPHPEEARLEELAAIGEANGVDAVLHHADDAPADAIVRIAEEIGADLIVIGNKGMKGARRILGSVANSVAHNAPCSVLIIDTMDAD